ncbi:uncharacterized protein LOC112346198 [Selaginella moellendorffii]|uniref:uncharacterized protein LOC112346198 n=1 Tax=Selaginella moellendorffii TaxID=88036 RepID=UPI000D1C7960|nr:uncharacterized protein LOC112346198 [Selaginella moellendorffii]|eukprot:XP_024530318.1 uncharacterized protein LOC112346198 [Selaginella moellendorffii]
MEFQGLLTAYAQYGHFLTAKLFFDSMPTRMIRGEGISRNYERIRHCGNCMFHVYTMLERNEISWTIMTVGGMECGGVMDGHDRWIRHMAEATSAVRCYSGTQRHLVERVHRRLDQRGESRGRCQRMPSWEMANGDNDPSKLNPPYRPSTLILEPRANSPSWPQENAHKR